MTSVDVITRAFRLLLQLDSSVLKGQDVLVSVLDSLLNTTQLYLSTLLLVVWVESCVRCHQLGLLNNLNVKALVGDLFSVIRL